MNDNFLIGQTPLQSATRADSSPLRWGEHLKKTTSFFSCASAHFSLFSFLAFRRNALSFTIHCSLFTVHYSLFTVHYSLKINARHLFFDLSPKHIVVYFCKNVVGVGKVFFVIFCKKVSNIC